VRIPKKGHGGRLGAEPGDLFIVTNVGKHPFFTRKGDNIYVTVPVSVPEAALGAKIEVPTVEGKAQLKRVSFAAKSDPARRSVRRSQNNAAESFVRRDEGSASTI
jgi:DnaJ-class molecular chaperone